MEVHYPNLKHISKPLKEYFFEFLMIFLAVTLGFFAENIRENIVEHHRERVYMKSLVNDLKADTSELKKDIAFTNYLIEGMDTMRNMLYDIPHVKQNSFAIYRCQYLYNRLVGAEFSDQTTTQLRSAGGMQLIRNENISLGISNYWNRIKMLQTNSESYKNRLFSAADISYTIFNRKYVLSTAYDSTNEHSLVEIDHAAVLMTYDENTLIAYANRISGVRTMLSTFYLNNLKHQLIAARNLISLIKNEYDFED